MEDNGDSKVADGDNLSLQSLEREKVQPQNKIQNHNNYVNKPVKRHASVSSDDGKTNETSDEADKKKQEVVHKGLEKTHTVKETIITAIKSNHIPDKIVFFLSVSTLIFLAIALINLQWLLPYYFSLATPILISYRFFQYWKLKWQLFLLDFCYFVNLCLMIFIWGVPWLPVCFTVLFAWCNGPVLTAVIFFRNSLVFHDTDRLTSVLIHIIPAFLTFGIRWYPEVTSAYWYTPFLGNGNFTEPDLVFLVAVPFGIYFCHALLYVVLIILVIKPAIEYLDTYRYFLLKGKGLMFRMIDLCGEKMRLFNFLLWNCIQCLATLFLTRLWYEYFEAHVTLLVVAFAVVIWNGGSFYMEKFSSRGFKADAEEHL